MREATDILSNLNPEQYEAVLTLSNPLLVLSGAGTGKTKVLTAKIAYIINEGFAFPSQILAVTFSNRAAREMKERLVQLIDGSEQTWLGTFHSICSRILRIHAEKIGFSRDFTIIDLDDQTKLIKQILKEINIDKKMAKQTASIISLWKDKCFKVNDARIDQNSIEGRVYKIYQERIISYNSMDFGDLLMYVIEIFKNNADVLKIYRNKFRYILVDEYQDTNMSQYLWLRMLVRDGQGLCCVGDDDQSIYSWRGAEIGNILRFEKDFNDAKIIRLERNYRSHGNILAAASSLIKNNTSRFGKTIWSEGEKGELVLIKKNYNGYEEASFVCEKIYDLHQTKNLKYSDFAILVRAGFQTREFEERLIAYGIPYKIIGGLKFYDRMEIKDIISYLRVVYQPNDSLAFERIINTPKRGIGAASIASFYSYAAEHNISLFKAADAFMKNGNLRPSLKKELQKLFTLIDECKILVDEKPVIIAKTIINETGYLTLLKADKTIESQTRIENINELLIALEDFENLAEFIEHISLVVDSPKTLFNDETSVMTLHAAKGSEFEAVFLVGWEEGVFPHEKSVAEGNVEEERRLAYVGITRAKKYLFVTYAQNRKIYNQWQISTPSRFINEIQDRTSK